MLQRGKHLLLQQRHLPGGIPWQLQLAAWQRGLTFEAVAEGDAASCHAEAAASGLVCLSHLQCGSKSIRTRRHEQAI